MNIKSILEIGSAIGYSTLCFASNKNIEKITSIERDDERYNIAIIMSYQVVYQI